METQILELLKTVSTQVYNIYYYSLIIDGINTLIEPAMFIFVIHTIFNGVIKLINTMEKHTNDRTYNPDK